MPNDGETEGAKGGKHRTTQQRTNRKTCLLCWPSNRGSESAVKFSDGSDGLLNIAGWAF